MSKYQMLNQTLQKIKRAEERLKILMDNKEVLEEEVRKQKTKLDKENEDVEQLEGFSLVGFIHLIKGTLVDKLDKEEREALVAKNKYEAVCQELKFCMNEIDNYREKIKDKYTIEREYKTIVKQLESQMLESDYDANKFNEITERMFYSNELLREIREAVEAGKELYKSFEGVLKSFEDAYDLGVIDILDTGLLVSETISSEVSERNHAIILIQQQIRKFHIEILDVCGIYNLAVDVDELLSFSDYLLYGIVKEDSVEEKLKFASEKINAAKKYITNTLAALEECKENVKLENKKINADKIEMIEIYLSKQGG